MKENSIWEDYLNKKSFPKISENMKTDVLIVGGGIAGVLTGYVLSTNGYKVILVEKDKVSSGNTKNTTAFVSAHHETIYSDIVKKHNYLVAKEYLKVNLDAIKEYEKLSNKYDFDFKKVDATLFSKDINIIEKEYEVLKKLDYNVFINKEIPLIRNVIGITLKDQAIINPIKLVNEIVTDENNKNLIIFENSEIVKIKGNCAFTKEGYKIDFNNIVLATHYPILNKLNFMFMKLTQTRSYVIAIKKEKINGTYCSIDENGYYFRSYKDYLIIGGNDRETKDLC